MTRARTGSIRRVRLIAPVAAAAAATLVLAACGGSSKPSAAGSSTPNGGPSSSASAAGTTIAATPQSSAPSSESTAPTAASSSVPSSPAATSGGSLSTAALTAITLQQSDVGATWKAMPFTPDSSDASTQKAMVACVGARDTTPDQTGVAHSPDYTLGELTVSSEADAFRSQSDVDSDVALLHSPKLNGCYQKLLQSEIGTTLPAGAKVNSLTITIKPGAAGGPSNLAATGTGSVAVTANGQRATVYLAVGFIVGPKVEANVELISLGAPVAAASASALYAKVAARAAKA